MLCKNKVTIIGAGMVGSTAAYSLVTNDIVNEIALIDIDKKLVESQVMDIEHAVPFYGYTKVKVGTYKDCSDSKAAIICCGAAQKPGETRLDLVKKNSKIIKEIIPKIFKQNPNIIIVMVANPVDVLTYLSVKMFPKKKKQIMGTGTILDSARFRHLIGGHFNINPRNIHAYIVGEHGDSELPLWSTASVGNMSLNGCKNLLTKDRARIFHQAKNAAYTIIEGKQATYYAIASGIATLIRAILYDKNTVLPVSHLQEGEFGVKDICLSMPAIVGERGIVGKICIKISTQEKKLLKKSSQALKKAAEGII